MTSVFKDKDYSDKFLRGYTEHKLELDFVQILWKKWNLLRLPVEISMNLLSIEIMK